MPSSNQWYAPCLGSHFKKTSITRLGVYLNDVAVACVRFRKFALEAGFFSCEALKLTARVEKTRWRDVKQVKIYTNQQVCFQNMDMARDHSKLMSIDLSPDLLFDDFKPRDRKKVGRKVMSLFSNILWHEVRDLYSFLFRYFYFKHKPAWARILL